MKYSRQKPPPDPENYVFVDAKEGGHYRRRRVDQNGLGALNTGFRGEVDLMSEASPAAARLHNALRPYKGWLDFGRFGARMTSLIRKALKAGAWPDYGLLREYHFQKEHPVDPMLRGHVIVKKEEGQVVVRLTMPEGGAVGAKSSVVHQYCFSLLLVAGDPVDKDVPLETALVEGPKYDYGTPEEGEDCVLSIPVPADGRPWMVCLRIESFFERKLARATRHHGLKVVAWG